MKIKIFLLSLFILIYSSPVYSDQKIVILMYHHIREVTGNRAGRDLSCLPDVFLSHLDWLRGNGYTTVTFKDIQTGKIVSKPIILTFDDGTYSHWYAFQCLQKRNIVGVFFPIVKIIGTRCYLNLEQLRKMADCGMEIGSHGLTHSNLNNASYKKLESEITQSKVLLEDLLKTQIITFCYPYGKYNKSVLEMMERSNYVYGRTTDEGISTFGRDRNFKLKIIYIHNSTRDLGKELK